MNLKRIFVFLPMVFFLALNCSCKQEKKSIQGYIEAEYTYLSSSVSGHLVHVHVIKGQAIQKGDLIFELDDQFEVYELDKAKANYAQARSQLKRQQNQLNYQRILLDRYDKLMRAGGISQEEFDVIENDYHNAKESYLSQEATVAVLKTEEAKIRWQQSNKKLKSPVAGYVHDLYYTAGEMVQATHPVVSVVTAESLFVVFFVFEPIISQIKLNQDVYIEMDGQKEKIPASISYISAKSEYTPPHIFSENTRSKFIYRIEAKPPPQILMQLHPGQPVSVYLTLDDRPLQISQERR